MKIATHKTSKMELLNVLKIFQQLFTYSYLYKGKRITIDLVMPRGPKKKNPQWLETCTYRLSQE